MVPVFRSRLLAKANESGPIELLAAAAVTPNQRWYYGDVYGLFAGLRDRGRFTT
jgi:hypothetical protein